MANNNDPFSAALAGVMAHNVERHQRRNDEAKAVDYYIKAHPEFLAQQNVPEEQYKGFGAADKIAMFKSFLSEQQVKHTTATIDALKAATDERAVQMRGQQEHLDSLREFGKTAIEATAPPIPYTGSPLQQFSDPGSIAGQGNDALAMAAQPQALNLENFSAAALAHPGAWNAPGAMPFINEAAGRYGGRGATDNAPRYFNEHGMEGVYSPKGGNFQLNPSQVAGTKLEAEKTKMDYAAEIRQKGMAAMQLEPIPGRPGWVRNPRTGNPHFIGTEAEKVGIDLNAANEDEKPGIIKRAFDRLFGGKPAATGAGGGAYESEAAARADGKQAGDVVYLNGVGKVKLK